MGAGAEPPPLATQYTRWEMNRLVSSTRITSTSTSTSTRTASTSTTTSTHNSRSCTTQVLEHRQWMVTTGALIGRLFEF